MPETPMQQLPYPALSDSAGAPLAFQQLAETVDRQLVMVFDSAAARDVAVSTPTAGMIAWLRDTDLYVYHDGAAWVTLGVTGDWRTYTPRVRNHGSATFTTRKGRWKRIAYKTVAVSILISVGNTAGTGSAEFQVALPTVPNREARCQLPLNVEATGLGIGSAVLLIGGRTDEFVDRLRAKIGAGQPQNINGSDLARDSLWTFSGVYEEK